MTGRPRSCFCGECKKCKRADYMRDWYRRTSEARGVPATGNRDPSVARRSDAKRKGTELRLASHRTDTKRRRLREPEKYKARTAVGNALRDGRLTRGVCEVCGSVKVEGHHDDYSQPLIVRWFCRPHHKQFHGHLRPDYPLTTTNTHGTLV